MKSLLLKAVLFGSALTLAGCASQPSISSQARPNVDFTSYKTYGWVTPLATDKAGYSTMITGYFKSAVQSEMAARGYTFDANNPDVQINFYSNVENRSETYGSTNVTMGYYGYRRGFGYGIGYPAYSSDVETRNYKVGTVSIDIVDSKRKELVWEGALEGTLSKKVMGNPGAAIQYAVTQIFTRYPVPSSATPVQ